MPKISDFLVKNTEEHDDCLHRELFPVNMRLLKSNGSYRLIVRDIIKYMVEALLLEYSDYGELKGISGANLGIPFNIIVVYDKNEGPIVMFNPKIIEQSEKTKIVKSNCGSLNLKKPIEVERHEWVVIEYHSEHEPFFSKNRRKFEGSLASTIQHEIDHNNGILITFGKKISSN